MKVLAIVSSLDLRRPYSCTPSWWQLLKALSEIGVDVIATPYAGRAVETPWWRAYENPCIIEGEIAFHAREGIKWAVGQFSGHPQQLGTGESFADRLTREIAQTWTRPRWERHIRKIVEREREIDAVLVLTVPLNQITGIARVITKRYGVPFYYYDGDVPASLPSFAGFQSGFKIYQGADLSEYEAFFSNSKRGAEELSKLGARRVHTLYYGVDPSIFEPIEIQQDVDVFFYGHGHEYRRNWVEAMLTVPSHVMPGSRFAIRGRGFDDMDLGRTERVPYLSVGKLREYCNRSKINLLINRQAHASVYASSTARPFELAAMRCCMVSSPYSGIEEWFEPETEVVMLSEPEEATERLRWLLDNPKEREQIAQAAYRRVLSEHTFQQRATEFVQLMSIKKEMLSDRI